MMYLISQVIRRSNDVTFLNHLLLHSTRPLDTFVHPLFSTPEPRRRLSRLGQKDSKTKEQAFCFLKLIYQRYQGRSNCSDYQREVPPTLTIALPSVLLFHELTPINNPRYSHFHFLSIKSVTSSLYPFSLFRCGPFQQSIQFYTTPREQTIIFFSHKP